MMMMMTTKHRSKLLKNQLLTQGYCKSRLIKIMDHNVVAKYDASVSKISWIYLASRSFVAIVHFHSEPGMWFEIVQYVNQRNLG